MFNFFGNKKREQELELENRVLKMDLAKTRQILMDLFAKVEKLSESHSKQIAYLENAISAQEKMHSAKLAIYEKYKGD